MFRNWWVILLRGLLWIGLGVVTLLMPEITLSSLILLFAFSVILSGILCIYGGIRKYDSQKYWWAEIIMGLLSIAAGVIALTYPGLTTLVMLSLIAGWSLINGVFEIITAIKLREVIENEWFYMLQGVLAVLFGILLFIFPGEGILSILWLFGIYLILTGGMLALLSLKLRGIHRQLTE